MAKRSLKKQDWNISWQTGKNAAAAVSDFLLKCRTNQLWFKTIIVHDLQDDPRYQPLGIDLLWLIETDSGAAAITVEVKGDLNKHTGNFFFETVSDLSKNTPGAFYVCKADWYFYYFINVETLYCLPMRNAKPWFAKHCDKFKMRCANSIRGSKTWQTQGALVPYSDIKAKIEGVRIFKKKDDSWIED